MKKLCRRFRKNLCRIESITWKSQKMNKRLKDKKILSGMIAAGGFFLILVGSAAAQQTALGQSYQSVYIDGTFVGYAAENVNVRDAILQARRELAAESEKRLCMDYDWSVEKENKPFVRLEKKDALEKQIKEILKDKIIESRERAYTVAIGAYRGNFTTLDEVSDFLNQVRQKSDEENAYTVQFQTLEGQIGGVLTADLVKAGQTQKVDDAAGVETATSLAGVSLASADQLEEAMTSDAADLYETGVLDMAFVENIEVYENYVQADAFTTADEAAAEVTKEKESNKIYVVESGDCLSVIALDHDTKVADIMALNGLENADSLREGQELIIAVPEPDLKIRLTVGEVYEEDYEEEPVIMENDSWYTNQEEVLEEGAAGHRERNDIVVYENGSEVSRELAHQKITIAAKASVIERGTIVPPTYIKPVAGGRFTSGFGRRWGRMHKGVDWACPVGTTVYASCAGTVIQASYNGGYGNNVVISHADGRLTRYAHNSKLLVKVGQKVEQGEPIALSGSTGRSTGPHVHFEIYIGGAAVNPLKYISN